MHTRGRREVWDPLGGGVGTTHAHAGQTSGHYRPRDRYRNHPCTRGADSAIASCTSKRLEPPMHTRGRLVVDVPPVRSSGTTHAHAGQTCRSDTGGYPDWNHPCTRGADWSPTMMFRDFQEPPMHTRGRRLLTRYNVRMSAKLYSVACIMQ